MKEIIDFKLNGKSTRLEVEGDRLSFVLRTDLTGDQYAAKPLRACTGILKPKHSRQIGYHDEGPRRGKTPSAAESVRRLRRRPVRFLQ
jgi:hypothetical protein